MRPQATSVCGLQRGGVGRMFKGVTEREISSSSNFLTLSFLFLYYNRQWVDHSEDKGGMRPHTLVSEGLMH